MTKDVFKKINGAIFSFNNQVQNIISHSSSILLSEISIKHSFFLNNIVEKAVSLNGVKSKFQNITFFGGLPYIFTEEILVFDIGSGTNLTLEMFNYTNSRRKERVLVAVSSFISITGANIELARHANGLNLQLCFFVKLTHVLLRDGKIFLFLSIFLKVFIDKNKKKLA